MIQAEFKSVRIFCAPPDNYDVVQGDNAQQKEGYAKFREDPEGNRARLLAAWKKVVNELTRLGHELLIPELDPNAPDQVFGADGVIHFIGENGRKSVLLSNMNSDERQLEVTAAEKMFREKGYDVYLADKNFMHEGTGESLFARDMKIIFMGYGPRSELEAGQHIADTTGQIVFALPLSASSTNDRYDGDAGGMRSKDVVGFHLDVLAQPLPTGHVICYEEGLPYFTNKALGLFYDNLFDEETRKFYSNLIKISKEDYEKFATNCFAVPDKEAQNGYTLFIPDDISPELKNTLTELGYLLFEVDIEVARWSGGGLHCMFNIEYDFSAKPTRKLNYVEEFLLNKWTNNEDRDRENRRGIPGLRVFRPQQNVPCPV